ncbi:hypothetical protein [Yersinia ruckeri]|uniref:hypothetical protein n=1 Tax=Yersinia ruckeri TaxID=29486 RepID=UPI001587B830|nr:hypothetical protein [Yersinia ruckeri]
MRQDGNTLPEGPGRDGEAGSVRSMTADRTPRRKGAADKRREEKRREEKRREEKRREEKRREEKHIR